jgi:hypothetical protein
VSTVAPPAAPPLDASHPWPGLESFREADAAFFRGRGAAAGELLRLLGRERLSVLYGVSGQGKSSLLQAGVFPTLRRQGMLPVYVRLVHAADAPRLGVQVLEAVERAAAAARVRPPRLEREDTLWENFHRRGAAFCNAADAPVTPVLVLDQFEEAFTHGQDTPARAAATREFMEELADLVEGRAPAGLRARLEADSRRARQYSFGLHPYKVLLALREDFLAHLETLRGPMPSVMVNRMRLTPLSGQGALAVTAAGGDALVPPDVGELIVRHLAEPQRPGVLLEDLTVDPALLSLFCREVNERRLALGQQSVTAGLVEGNRESILRDFYVRSLKGLPRTVRVFVEDRLLTRGGAFRDTEALENAREAGVSTEALDTLVERRLIRREERGGRTRLELTHDVLAPVIAESRDHRTFRVRLARVSAAAVLLLALGVGAVMLMLNAIRNEGLARQREREALLQAELSAELLRLEDQSIRQGRLRDTAAELLVRDAFRRADVLEAALCDASSAGGEAIEPILRRARRDLRDDLLCVPETPVP